MNSQNILVYGADWCNDCVRAKRLLERYEIPFSWIDVDNDREAQGYVKQVNNGTRIIPNILFPDGSILVEPADSELASLLAIRSWAIFVGHPIGSELADGVRPTGLTDVADLGGRCGHCGEGEHGRDSRRPG